MINREKVRFNFIILLIFAVLEVVLFNADNSIKSIVAFSEYIFVIIVFFINIEIGLMYFFSFIILTLGWGNYDGLEEVPSNFWGLRLGDFSLSIVVTAFFTVLLILTNRIEFKRIANNRFFIFIFLYFIYCTLNGFIRYFQGLNFNDNLVEDILMYAPAIFFILLLSVISIENIKKLFLYAFPLTLIQMLFSVLSEAKFKYGLDYFIVQNSMYLISPFAIFLLRKQYQNAVWILMISTMLIFLLTGQYFISGKSIILLIFTLIWYISLTKKKLLLFFLPLILLIFNLSQILTFLESLFETSSAIGYKFQQINEAIQYMSDPFIIASAPSSIGNIFAEFLSVSRHLYENLSFLLFGKGFGAGIPDYWGFLSPFTEMAGYREIDGTRNDFFKMHLPIFDIALKGGLFFLGLYVYMLIDFLKSKSFFGFVCFLLLFTIFALSKEMMLLSLICVYCYPVFLEEVSINSNI